MSRDQLYLDMELFDLLIGSKNGKSVFSLFWTKQKSYGSRLENFGKKNGMGTEQGGHDTSFVFRQIHIGYEMTQGDQSTKFQNRNK